MSLADHRVENDKFELFKDGVPDLNMIFPCNNCKHRFGEIDDEPCNSCGHSHVPPESSQLELDIVLPIG